MATYQLPRSQTVPLTGEPASIPVQQPSTPASAAPQPIQPDSTTAQGISSIFATVAGMMEGPASWLEAPAVEALGAGTATAVTGMDIATLGLTAAGVALAIFDPARIVGMGPQSGLQVTPVTFQSVEQEGRWKPSSAFTSASRQFDPPSAGSNIPYALANQTGNAFGQIQKKTVPLFTISCDSGSEVTADVTWWFDNLEIYAGYAGMSKASGFGSVYSDMASITFQAIPFGNYYPAKALITWFGWVNPIGPNYQEFRGAFIVSADGKYGSEAADGDAPMYMNHWDRDGNDDPYLEWNSEDGFLFDVPT